MERVLAGEEVFLDHRLVLEDRAARDVRVSYVPHRDPGGKVRGYVALVTDISEMKAVEAALRRSEGMLEQAQATAHVGSWELTYDEKLEEIPGSTLWSAETYRILGYPPGTAANRTNFRERVHPADRDALSARMVRGIERAEPMETEYRIVRPDGSVRVLHAWLHFERALVKMHGGSRCVRSARDSGAAANWSCGCRWRPRRSGSRRRRPRRRATAAASVCACSSSTTTPSGCGPGEAHGDPGP